jgi:hypothetical protein
VVPHQGSQLSLADIRLWKGAKIRSSFPAFSKDGMTLTAFLLNKDPPPLLDVSRKKVFTLLLSCCRMIPEEKTIPEKEASEEDQDAKPFHLSFPFRVSEPNPISSLDFG